jgi:hypothetical protein
MLRIITEQSGGGTYRFELHGSLTGDGVGVLEKHWHELLHGAPTARVTVGLSNVMFVDADGERLLRWMGQRGVEFDGDGCMNRYVIDKISGGV